MQRHPAQRLTAHPLQWSGERPAGLVLGVGASSNRRHPLDGERVRSHRDLPDRGRPTGGRGAVPGRTTSCTQRGHRHGRGASGGFLRWGTLSPAQWAPAAQQATIPQQAHGKDGREDFPLQEGRQAAQETDPRQAEASEQAQASDPGHRTPRRDSCDSRNRGNALTRRDVDWDRLIQEYIEGKDAVTLADQYHVHSSIIYARLEKMGIDRRRSGDVRRQYHFNERYFYRLDSASPCYWLGFLFADGSISEVSNALRVNLQASDAAHLQALLTDLEATSHQVRYKVTSGHSVAGIALTSLYLRQDLASWGMALPNSERQIPPMPQQFKLHFIKAYFDGDGSISVHRTLKREGWKASIVSTSHTMVEQIALAICSTIVWDVETMLAFQPSRLSVL